MRWSLTDAIRRVLFWTAAVLLVAGPAGANDVVIVQTNSAGDNVHLIDPATNKVVAVIRGVEAPHGAAVAPDGSAFYFSNEGDHTLDRVDARTLAVTRKVPLSGRPNNVAISKDGRRVYVGIIEQPGAVDVVDTVSLAVVKTIRTPGGIHNLYVTPDGRHVVAGSPAGRNLTVIDVKTEEPEWVLYMGAGVRPFTFDTNPDGSTRRIFVQLSGLHGFAVVDFAARREVSRVTLPDVPPAERFAYNASVAGAHGIGVTPDGKALWSTSTTNSAVYGYALPDLQLLGGVRVGLIPDWITFTPDSRFAYVANTGTNDVSVVDVQAMTEVTRIKVGQAPKRNITAVLPSAAPAVVAVPTSSGVAQALDLHAFRTRVEPIFTKPREGNSFACVGCHTTVASRFRLQPLASGATAWTEEQSRRNLESVARLVVPGEPLKSRLLLHPLAAEAGGDPTHTGGKFWQSQDDPEWRTLADWVRSASPGVKAAAAAPPPALDFETFKSRVQPIFLNKREDRARCYVCHARGAGGTGFGILPLPAGSAFWTEEESRRNFEAIQRVVVPGDPLASRLLMKPLAAEAGGELTHHGGKHWTSQDDPEWQALAAWVRGSR